MKVIYKPKGKAGEYSKYAINFYNGCSNGCEYCYLKRGVLSTTLGGDNPTLQKRYRSPEQAIRNFIADIYDDGIYEELKSHGLFFTFSSDPFLPETKVLNMLAVRVAVERGIPCTMLTKRADCISTLTDNIPIEYRKMVSVGFTLTGCDEMEPYASTNMERIESMKILHDLGFKVWASIEPIINPISSLAMIRASEEFCDHFKVGLRSGVKKDYYNNEELGGMFIAMEMNNIKPTYLKDSFVSRLKLNRESLGAPFVGADFNMFNRDEK